MFYNIEKLNELEKIVSDNLSTADCLNDSSSTKELRPIWINYRSDMPKCLMVIREYRELLRQYENKSG
tara:strand:+ start:4598 stop:4801 length:204 start_codon:yes stop_codon:yes gene_type:complete